MGLEEKGGREASPESQARPQVTQPTRGSDGDSVQLWGPQTKQLQIGVAGHQQPQNNPISIKDHSQQGRCKTPSWAPPSSPDPAALWQQIGVVAPSPSQLYQLQDHL